MSLRARFKATNRYAKTAKPSLCCHASLFSIFFYLFFTLLLIPHLTSSCYAADLTVIAEDFPPFAYTENNRTTGVATLIVQAILAEAGLTATIKTHPLARAYQFSKQQPRALIYPLNKTPERELQFYWIDELITINIYAYKLTSRRDIQIENKNDIAKFRVGVVNNGMAHEYMIAKGYMNFVAVSQFKYNLRMLERGRTDIMLMPEETLQYFSRSLNININKFEKIRPIDELCVTTYLALSKNSSPEIVEKLIISAKKITTSEKKQKIIDSYFADLLSTTKMQAPSKKRLYKN